MFFSLIILERAVGHLSLRFKLVSLSTSVWIALRSVYVRVVSYVVAVILCS